VKAGSTSDQTTCLTDFLATTSEIVGANLPVEAAEDSVSMLPALLGKAEKPLREAIVHHSINGSFAIRQGSWKLCFCPGSGGWSAPRPNRDETTGLPPVQLFDLATDIGEQKNLQADKPEIVAQLTRLMEKYVNDGRSTAGTPQKNAVAVNFHSGEKLAPPAAKAKNKKGK